MLDDKSEAQKERIRFIDYHAFFLGRIVRKDIQERFGIAAAAATRDLSLYNELVPDNLIYQPNIRSYAVSEMFSPLFEYPAEPTLEKLANDFHSVSFVQERSLRIGRLPSINYIAMITRAIHLNRVLECEYLSTSSGRSTKQLVIHSLFDTGLHWYMRGYDRSRNRFADFALSRVISVNPIQGSAQEYEMKGQDSEWNHIITLKITAHKNLDHPEAIQFDYGMVEGVLEKEVRASLSGYLLRRWNVDCTDSGALEGAEYQLCLANVAELKSIDAMFLAPGFSSS